MDDFPPPWGWRRVACFLLYTLQFQPALDDDLARLRAGGLVLEPFRGFTREEEYEGLQEALASDEELVELLPTPWPVPHDEQDVRDFLRRVLEQMDLRRPWPELPFTVPPITADPDRDRYRAIARLRLDENELSRRIHANLARVGDGGRWLPLLLNSGDEVALATPHRPGGDHVAVLARTDAERPPEEILAAFLHVTGFTLEEIDDLTDGVNPVSRGGAGSGWLAYLLRRGHSVGALGEDAFRTFSRTRLYCEAGETPGFIAVGPPGEGLVPAFTLPEGLAAYAEAKGQSEPRYFSATGRDLLALVPEGYGVLVDPGTAYATAFDGNGPRQGVVCGP
ncbi:SseB family protein [Nonomuraea sp. NPDC048826]|uniref:SseB family protein n=1 Tax=Nonomuraea sp. NPDC048826 TaxID=3364347 RepID=UPI003716B116